MPSEVDYCLFCGARLSMDDHFVDHEDCATSFEQWDGARSTTSSTSPTSGPSQAQQAVAWVLIAAVMLYALLIQRSVLLGVIASGIIFIASRIDWTNVA